MLAAMITGDRDLAPAPHPRRLRTHRLLPPAGRLRPASRDLCRTHLLARPADSSASTLGVAASRSAAALAYAVFTGFGQPVQRSFWMVTLYLLARLLWRERSALNAIGFAALCLLAANPPSLFDAGFQMTAALGDRHRGNRDASRRSHLCALSSRHQESFAARDRPSSAAKGGAVSRHPQASGNPPAAAHWQEARLRRAGNRHSLDSACCRTPARLGHRRGRHVAAHGALLPPDYGARAPGQLPHRALSRIALALGAADLRHANDLHEAGRNSRSLHCRSASFRHRTHSHLRCNACRRPSHPRAVIRGNCGLHNRCSDSPSSPLACAVSPSPCASQRWR